MKVQELLDKYGDDLLEYVDKKFYECKTDKMSEQDIAAYSIYQLYYEGERIHLSYLIQGMQMPATPKLKTTFIEIYNSGITGSIQVTTKSD